MTTYRVTYDDGQRRGHADFEAPERLPQFGDIYEWVKPRVTAGGVNYEIGDRMMVLERTDLIPHHRQSSLGNLRVNGKKGTSVWTCFELCIAEGLLKLVEPA